MNWLIKCIHRFNAPVLGALLCLLALVCAAPSAASAGRTQIRVGYTDVPGFFSRDGMNIYNGRAYEYLETIAVYLHIDNIYTEGSEQENLERLAAGEIDCIPCPLPYEDEQIVSLQLDHRIGYIAIRRQDAAYQVQLTAALESIDRINPFFRSHLLEKYHVPDIAAYALTTEERKYLTEHGPLRIILPSNQEPLSYVDEDGSMRGMLPEIMRLMAGQANLDIELMPHPTPAELPDILREGNADIIGIFYHDYNWANENGVDITFPYLKLDYVPIIRKDQNLPEKPTVACARGFFFCRDYLERNYPPEQIRYYDSLKECLLALNNREADYTLARALTAQNDIMGAGLFNLYTNGTVAFSHGITLAVSKQADPHLIHILEKSIAHLDHGAVESIITRNSFELKQKGSLSAFLYRNPLESMAIIGGVAMFIVLAMFAFLMQKRRFTDQMYQLAHTNLMTGMHNLRWFEKELPRLIQERKKARRNGQLFVMVLTVDRIAFLKESYDLELLVKSLLKHVARVRKNNPWLIADACNSEVNSIYVFCETPPELTMLQAAERITADGAYISIGNIDMNFTYRIGIAPVPSDHDLPPGVLIANAQTALNESFTSGRNIEIYNDAMSARIQRQQQMEDYMNKALAEKEFKIWLQAKYDLKTHKANGAEALVRWDSPELGFLMPGSFIGLFERNGFAVDLDYYMLERTCELQAERVKAGLPIVPISVNQSGLHITETGYIKQMREVMERWKLPLGAIELEITETAFIDFTTKEQREEAANIIDQLQEIGFSLSMDDFCTGYSSLSMLQNLPMNVMKIDRSILLSAETSQRALRILRHVIDLGKALGMRVLTEGIETEEQEKLLIGLGCDYGQGFLFAQPMPAREFYEEFLPKHQ